MMRRESRYAAHRRRMNRVNFEEQLLQRGDGGSFDGWTEVVTDDDQDEDESW
ncbi:hypothetical protein MCHLDSM_03023 [Mycolicibacterium chlorophenolicum]|uniref:Uncharacterized protein n=2 Tax=Mycolicibacterium chlorophenolicum TaxID=37916 RepID=A0A0J6W388_9MYCO|nr:hypothetical protein MCHLDSM_03023 [Mycolicibacterium chlorophenolicum]